MKILISFIILALITAAFFSGSETAFTNFDKLTFYGKKIKTRLIKK